MSNYKINLSATKNNIEDLESLKELSKVTKAQKKTTTMTGTTNLTDDVLKTYKRTFGKAITAYNKTQDNEANKIVNYFEQVSNAKSKAVAQCFTIELTGVYKKNNISDFLSEQLHIIEKEFGDFKIANATMIRDGKVSTLQVLGICPSATTTKFMHEINPKNIFNKEMINNLIMKLNEHYASFFNQDELVNGVPTVKKVVVDERPFLEILKDKEEVAAEAVTQAEVSDEVIEVINHDVVEINLTPSLDFFIEKFNNGNIDELMIANVLADHYRVEASNNQTENLLQHLANFVIKQQKLIDDYKNNKVIHNDADMQVFFDQFLSLQKENQELKANEALLLNNYSNQFNEFIDAYNQIKSQQEPLMAEIMLDVLVKITPILRMKEALKLHEPILTYAKKALSHEMYMYKIAKLLSETYPLDQCDFLSGQTMRLMKDVNDLITEIEEAKAIQTSQILIDHLAMQLNAAKSERNRIIHIYFEAVVEHIIENVVPSELVDKPTMVKSERRVQNSAVDLTEFNHKFASLKKIKIKGEQNQINSIYKLVKPLLELECTKQVQELILAWLHKFDAKRAMLALGEELSQLITNEQKIEINKPLHQKYNNRKAGWQHNPAYQKQFLLGVVEQITTNDQWS